MRFAGNLHAELLLGLGLRGAGAVSGFALTWMIARVFGADVVGLHQLGQLTVTLASLFVSAGLDYVLVREVAALMQAGRRGDARATFLMCRRVVLRNGIPAILLVAALALPFSHLALGQPRAAPFIMAFAPAVLLAALLKVGNAMLRTTGRIVLSQTLEGVFYTTFAMAILAFFWASGADVNPLLPALAWVFGVLLANVIAWIAVKRMTAHWPLGKSAAKPTAGLTVVAVPVLTSGGEWLVLLLIAGLGTLADTGVYRIAFQICMLFHLVASSFASMAGPHLARAAALGDSGQLFRVVGSGSLIGLGLCLPLAAVGLAAPGWLLGLFGPEFREGAVALQLLTIAQLVNVAFYPAGTALIMMHRERYVLAVELCAMIIVVTTAAAAIGGMGVTGAALGVLLGSVVRNSAYWVAAARTIRALAPSVPHGNR